MHYLKIKNFKLKIILFVLSIIFCIVPTKNADAAILVRPPTNLGLVGYWPMDEGVGTKVMDLSGRDSAGTISGATWTSGKRGGALSFNGVNETGSSVTLPSYLIGAPNSIPFTISFWLYWDSSDPDTLVTPFRDSTNIAGTGTFFPAQSGSNIYFRLGSINSTSVGGVSSYQNKWVHFVLTNNTSVATLYADGVVVTTGTPGSFSNVSPWVVGRNGTAAERDKSKFDDIRIYNRALTATEVANLYNSGQVTRKQVSNQGLVGYWSFNEGNGTKAGDSSGLGNIGDITGATWTSGKRGGALSFDGNDGVKTGNATLGSTSYTISAWIKPTMNSSTGSIFYYHNGSNANRLILQLLSGKLRIYDDTGGGNAGSVAISNNAWTFVTVTFNGSNRQLYVNASADGSLDPSSYNPSTNNGPYEIGQSSTGSQFNGSIDDVRIYNRALSTTEVQALYKQTEVKINSSQNDKLTDGLVGLWSFDGADINWATGIAYDRSGQGNNGNISGMSTTTSPAMGKIGQALKFDGVNDHVRFNAATTNLWSISEPRTISFWSYINTLSTPNLYPVLFNFKTTGSSFSMYYSNQNNRKGINFGYNASTFMAVTSTDISSSLIKNWRHVVLISDGVSTTTTSGYKLYVDGVSQSISSSAASWTSQNVNYIGTDDVSSADTVNGIIDDVRVYNRALSESEVKQLYNMGRYKR